MLNSGMDRAGDKTMTHDDSYTTAVALSCAIAAVEKLPAEWQDKDDLTAMKALMGRVDPDSNFRTQFVDVARSVLDGNEKPRTRPKLV